MLEAERSIKVLHDQTALISQYKKGKKMTVLLTNAATFLQINPKYLNAQSTLFWILCFSLLVDIKALSCFSLIPKSKKRKEQVRPPSVGSCVVEVFERQQLEREAVIGCTDQLSACGTERVVPSLFVFSVVTVFGCSSVCLCFFLFSCDQVTHGCPCLPRKVGHGDEKKTC